MKKYLYTFTRQDMSNEQQLVQTAHVTYLLGTQIGTDAFLMDTHFVCIGVRNLAALNAVADILIRFAIRFESFIEPDLDGGEYTSLATYPVDEDKRGVLLAFNILKF